MGSLTRIAIYTLIVGLVCFSALFIQAEEKSGFDKAWSYLTLYENAESNFQKFTLAGRAQLDAVWVDPDGLDEEGKALENFSDTRWRRFRFGAEAHMFDTWKLHLEANFDLNEDFSDWYTNLTDAYIQWENSKKLKIKAFKQSAGFTLDGDTSSKRLLSLERNNLTNNLWFTAEYFNGILVTGKFAGNFSYKASFFSSGGAPEFDWDGASWFTFWQLGYKVNDEFKLRLDYVYQDEDEQAASRDFEQILSFVPKWQSGPWGVWGDISFGKGFVDQGQEDVWGFHFKPFYDFNDNLQVVLAYTLVDGNGDNSVRLNRYDNRVDNVDSRGDRVQDVYGGVNVYFYGHKFKWQTGVTFTTMDDASEGGQDFEGWTLSTGLRVYW
ncbi:MAG: OprO/OprP family phosphate-selective porin [Desulfofustis sp.]|nr:OprO/OprP family phosphate-selective porin [Desulfofustis sp.]